MAVSIEMYTGSDFGFVGQSYEAPMVLQDTQRLINWYVEMDPNPEAKEQLALLGCPGLLAVASTLPGQVRGMWVLPGSQAALVVTGATVWLMTITVPATANSLPKYATRQVGNLLTNAGPVCIRDNGVQQNGLGGFAVIVDGTYGYYYLLSGVQQTVTFGAATTFGSNVIGFPGVLPAGLIVSTAATLSDTGGAIAPGTVFTAINSTSLTATMSKNAGISVASDTMTLTIPPFGQITDPGFLGAQRIAFIEGWLVFNLPNTRTFYSTGPTPYQMIFPGAFFALKDSSTDNLITLQENNRELWLIGERTAEVWYNAGGINFPFQRIPGVGPQVGCAAVYSLTRVGTELAWLARNEQGQNIVVITEQYSYKRISTHGVEQAIASYPVVSDCIGYGYEEAGHGFLVMVFPTADVTWVFDITSGAWHQRASFQSTTGQFHRHRGNCFMDFGDVRLVGDYQTGQIHRMSRDYYDDNGAPLVCVRRTPHVWTKANRERVFFSQLQIEFTPGVGLQVGQGSDPQLMLRWSDDGGFTWSNQHWVTIGKAGQTRNRAIFRQLGRARDRVWEATFSDPVQRDIIGATLFAEPTA
jgi:hypothetical protein